MTEKEKRTGDFGKEVGPSSRSEKRSSASAGSGSNTPLKYRSGLLIKAFFLGGSLSI